VYVQCTVTTFISSSSRQARSSCATALYRNMTKYSDLPYDILYALCSLLHETDFHTLREFSLVDKRSRMVATTFLFLNVSFRDRFIGNMKGMSARLDSLLRNNHILESVRSVLGHIPTEHPKAVDFRQFIFEPFSGRAPDPDECPMPIALFDLLRSLTGLKELHLLLYPQYLDQVQNGLLGLIPAEAGGQEVIQDNALSSIISLILPSSDWISLSPAFPNLSKLEIRFKAKWGDHPSPLCPDFAALSKAHPNLTTLHCQAPGTTKVIQGTLSFVCKLTNPLTTIKDIAAAFPNIVDLGLFGALSHGWDEPDSILVKSVFVFLSLVH
jgi:hypothetical protein